MATGSISASAVLEVFHTPGHSPGGVSFLDREARALFVGDLLYLGPMLLFFPGGDPAAFRESLRLAEEIVEDVDTIYPAHDSVPLVPDDVHAIRDAYETVWAGRAPDRHGTLYGYRAADPRVRALLLPHAARRLTTERAVRTPCDPYTSRMDPPLHTPWGGGLL